MGRPVVPAGRGVPRDQPFLPVSSGPIACRSPARRSMRCRSRRRCVRNSDRRSDPWTASGQTTTIRRSGARGLRSRPIARFQAGCACTMPVACGPGLFHPQNGGATESGRSIEGTLPAPRRAHRRQWHRRARAPRRLEARGTRGPRWRLARTLEILQELAVRVQNERSCRDPSPSRRSRATA